MIIQFEKNGNDLEWWELDERGIVINCNHKDIWGAFWIGCSVANHVDILPGDKVTFISKSGECKTTFFEVIRVKYAEVL